MPGEDGAANPPEFDWNARTCTANSNFLKLRLNLHLRGLTKKILGMPKLVQS